MTNTQFNGAKAEYLERLEQFVPIVERVHGAENPEFYEVRKLFDVLNEKIKLAGVEKPVIDEELTQLREITNDYEIPADVCESYEAVYNMLEEIDKAYHNEAN